MCHMCNIRRTPPETREKRRCTFEKNVQQKCNIFWASLWKPLKLGKKYVALLISTLRATPKLTVILSLAYPF